VKRSGVNRDRRAILSPVVGVILNLYDILPSRNERSRSYLTLIGTGASEGLVRRHANHYICIFGQIGSPDSIRFDWLKSGK
jgi:hypothetical protein